MSNDDSQTFLDVPTLLEQSQPRPRGNLFWMAAGGFLLLVIMSAYVARQGGAMGALVNLLSAVMMLVIIAGMGAYTWMTVRAARSEQQQLEAIEELIQLRKWPQAAAVVQQMLSRPTRTPGARVQGLIFLGTILARYNRFDDAIAVHNHLLDNVLLDDGTSHALRLGRAMAMLRQDHLVDADQAINEMRRHLRGANAAAAGELENIDAIESAGLALIQIYRDVKTGHPTEAVQLFEKKLPMLRRQLGHRVGDAWALAARAYHMLGRVNEAQTAWENATLLTDRLELERRYPEIASLSSKYRAIDAPAAA